jgi:acetyltransferase-like isoleucine patch superfamily enzyme
LTHSSTGACEIAATAILHPGVELGKESQVMDYVLLGVPARGRKPGAAPTRISEQAVIRSHAVIYAGVMIGKRFQCGHSCLIREDTSIGDHVSIGSHTVVEFQVRIADHVRIHSQAFIPEYSVLEEGCWIGPNVVLTNAKYPAAKDTKAHLAGVTIGPRAKVGANATILPGVRLGADCLIGAGSVVADDVPAGAVVVGNPGRVIKMVADLKYGGSHGKEAGQPYEQVAMRAAG